MLQRVFAALIGSLLLGLGINGFLVPHQLLDGGITGIALVLHYYTGFPTGLSLFLLSIPICIYTWIYRRIFFYNSFLGLIIVSISIDWLGPLRNQFLLSIFPSVLLGGIFIGLGVGIMLRYQTSTGGTDLLAQILSETFCINIGIVILIIDGLIVMGAFNMIGIKSVLFSCLTIFIIGIITSLIAKPHNQF
ncbi:YitT family protein [Bacillus salipaludis]|uniref:YitT family protein n=1 Tax=Bacillus salipaludis TaxID=2547811 RepID=UPI002E1A1621|nr:YitT family protein [Bacillus salipaludis]